MENKHMCIKYGALLHKVLVGVPLTKEQLTIASEAIAKFIAENNISHLFDDIVLKTSYRCNPFTEENKIESWLETKSGYRLNYYDMEQLKARILWNKKFSF